MGNARLGRAAPRCRRRGGFTVLELMFALTVMSIAVLAAFSSHLSSLDLVRTSRETAVATADMQAAFELLFTVPPFEVPGTFPEGVAIPTFQDLHLRSQSLVLDYPGWDAGEPVPDPLEVVLTMSWLDHEGRPRTVRMATMLVQ